MRTWLSLLLVWVLVLGGVVTVEEPRCEDVNGDAIVC